MSNRQGFALISLLAAMAMVPVAILVTSKIQQALTSSDRSFNLARTHNNIERLRDYIVRHAADVDNDGRYELLAPSDAVTPPLARMPLSVPFNSKDDFGTEYLYCAYDPGSHNLDISSSPRYTDNDSQPVGPAGTLGKIISAGRDRLFDTDCAMNEPPPGSDDISTPIYEASVIGANSSAAGWKDYGDYVGPVDPADNVNIGGVNAPASRLELPTDVNTPDGGLSIGRARIYNSNATVPGPAINMEVDLTGGFLDLSTGGMSSGGLRQANPSIIADYAGNINSWTGAILLNNNTANRIVFSGAGAGAPNLLVPGRPAGTKLALKWSPDPLLTGDYSLGYAPASSWLRVPEATNRFAWYGGAARLLQLDGRGHLGLAANADPTTVPIGASKPGYALVVGTGNATARSINVVGGGYFRNHSTLRTGGNWLPSDNRENLRSGLSAFTNNTTGSHNIAAGYEALADSTVADENIAFGQSAGKHIGKEVSNSGNIAFGLEALLGNTAVAITGAYNIAFGNEALSNIGSGSNNIAFGRRAASFIGSGVNNIAMGTDAMRGRGPWPHANSGSNNFAAGHGSLLELSSGSNNIAFGIAALQNHGYWDVSSNNIALGAASQGGQSTMYNVALAADNFSAGGNSLERNILSSDNIAVGYGAIEKLDGTLGGNIGFGRFTINAVNGGDGGDNIAFGDRGLQYISSGDNNVVFGAAALGRNTTGSDNIGVGLNALYYATTGVGNIAFGPGAAGNMNFGTLLYANAGSHNIAFGYNAGIYLGGPAGGSHNIALGKEAAAGVVYGSNTAAFNIAIGTQALYSIGNGNYNIALGNEALLSAGNNSSNIAIGLSSLKSLTTGDNNIAIGYEAQKTPGGSHRNSVVIGTSAAFSMSGADNVVVSQGAGNSAGAGVRNVAIGRHALNYFNAIDKGDNVAIGYYTLLNNIAANNNIAIGHNTAVSTSGAANIAIGVQAMVQGWPAWSGVNTETERNIAIGRDALYSVRSGKDNIAIGHSAASKLGVSAGNDGNINLGDYSGWSLADATNSTRRHSIAIGNGAGIYGIYTNRGIAIGAFASQFDFGQDNIAIGPSTQGFWTWDVLYGGYNVTIGVQTATSSKGSRNVAIGWTAGYSIKTDDNVSIGVNAGGSVAASDGTGGKNVAIGQYAGQGARDGSSSNIAIGPSTETGTTGKGNISIGVSGLNSITTESDNIAVGSGPMGQTANGARNIVFGYRANNDTTGNDNIVFGMNAGNTLFKTSRSIVIGNYALTGNSSSLVQDNNIAVGYAARQNSASPTGTGGISLGWSNMTLFYGNYNIGIGYNTIPTNWTNNGTLFGDQNIAIGLDTMLIGTATTVTRNIAIGTNASRAPIGVDNIAIGYAALAGRSAGASAGSGSTNIAIGSNSLGDAGFYGSSNIAIGHATGWLTTGSVANNLMLGYAAGHLMGGPQNQIVLQNHYDGAGWRWTNRVDITTVANASVNLPLAAGQKILLNGNVIISGELQVNSIAGVAVGVVSTGGIFSASDGRYKTNTVPLGQVSGFSGRFTRLQGVYYDWRTANYPERGFNAGRQIGFIAQNVEESFPELVQTDRAGFKALAYDKLTAVLVEADKAEQVKLDDHARRLAGVESSLSALRSDEISAIRSDLAAIRAATEPLPASTGGLP